MAAIEEASGIDLSATERALGSKSFARGRTYARGGRVVRVQWDPDTAALSGSVVGQGGLYRTTAQFRYTSGISRFVAGTCTCPVAHNCKHVAAIVVAACDRGTFGLTRQATATASARPSRQPSWETSLRALVDAPRGHESGISLAIELRVENRGGAGRTDRPRLLARIMRAAARGGWVNGSLDWNGLESWRVEQAGLRPDHVSLARELGAVQHAATTSWRHRYGAEKSLDLTDCGPQLWSLLDEAARLGLPLVHAGSKLGELAPTTAGEIVLDVTRPGRSGALVRARLHAGDDVDDLQAVLFLGATGHGVVCADPTDVAPATGRLRLVRLARPAPAPLQRMVLEARSLTVPAADIARFADDLCLSLQRVARVVSSDESFVPPVVSSPSLTLRVSYGERHAVEVAWQWAYHVGESTHFVPLALDESGAGFRDVDAERALLGAFDLRDGALADLGLVDGLGRPVPGPSMPVSLLGPRCMQFTTEDLPRLLELSDLTVEVDGEPPDYRDVAESIEIGVATTDVEGDRDWFGLSVTIAIEGRVLPFADVFLALANGEPHVLLDDGAHFSLDDPRLQRLGALIEEARSLVDSPTAPLRISRYQAGLWSELAALGVVTEQSDAWQRQADAVLALDALPDHEPPSGLLADLRHYQRDGFAWLAALWDLGLGGILADDMGLGKTLQALALMCCARERDPDLGPFLVVAPTSVVSGWVGEAAQFAPKLAVEAVTETFAKSGRDIDAVADTDVVVTTYALLRLDIDRYRSIAWAGVIFDEAQNVKNHHAKAYQCARELDSRFKLALSGTPMENNLMELWSLLSITAPGLFPDPKAFAEHYARPIERGDADRLAALRRRIKPILKRRTKELVARDLPAKQEQTLEVELHPRHRKVYDRHLQRERQRVLGLLGDFDRNRFTILRSITLLRQLSLHAALADSRHERVPCAKLGALTEQLDDVIAGGHRALVFSQFTSFLSKARHDLDRAGIGYCYLDGRTRNRERVIDRFRAGDDPVFLISLKAGGVGLNLTEADYCFLLDPWWNPATENQAVDRAHRIGQTRPVMVYRLVAKDTIEEKVVALARRKAALFKGVMDDGDLFASSVTADDIRGLFS